MKWNEIDQQQREQVVVCLLHVVREGDRLYEQACANNLYAQSKFLMSQVQGIYAALDALGWCPIERKWKEVEP
jgi:hypothetical protein